MTFHTDEYHEQSTPALLLDEARARRNDAWAEVVERYSGSVYNRCRTLGLTPEEAADVTQETFAAAFRDIHRFRKQEANDGFRKWLFAVAKNKARDHFRRQRKQVAEGQGGTHGVRRLLTVTTDQGATRPVSATASPDAMTSHVRRALLVIEDDFQAHTWRAFWRTAVDEQPAVDVARELSMTPAAVRKAKSRVLDRLRHELRSMQDG